MSDLPKLLRVRQRLPRPQLADVESSVRAELDKLRLDKIIQPGATVAIPAGSRGIADIGLILKTTVSYLQSLGAAPFLAPSMGSHGGATTEGQVALLAAMGITESSCGCPIRSSMKTVELFRCAGEFGDKVSDDSPDRFPVHFDQISSKADHVLIVGRVKPHTIYGGDFQSGLAKMLIVGMGNHDGAKQSHQAADTLGFDTLVRKVAPRLISDAKVIGGLAILENPYDEVALVEAVAPEDFLTREPQLLNQANRWLPGLPFKEVDVLLVDELGKNISGSGMDTNVIGRKQQRNQASANLQEPRPSQTNANDADSSHILQAHHIIARSLTPESRGNALGVGLADFCLKRLADAIDQEATWTNGLTSGSVDAVKLPPVVENDRKALEAALALCGLTRPELARVVWIKNTREVAEVACSVAYQAEAEARDDLEILTVPSDWPFNAEGNLPETIQNWS